MKIKEKIYNTIIEKESNICVSLDYTSFEDIISVIEILKDKIIMVKTHCDIIENYNDSMRKKMVKLCKENNIFIFEDRKFADIGNTFREQFTGGIYKIREWCDITNFHTLVGEGIINEFKSCKKESQGGLLVAEMSNKGNFLDSSYRDKTVEMAQKHKDSIIGFISQRKICDGFLHLTPGIRLRESGDDKDQQYTTPGEAISKGVDILIVGRGIITSENMLEECEKYRVEAWENYKKLNNIL